jgi:hypothetical protein
MSAIIMYENGKAVGGEGHPTNADDITFDNSNTDLVSENVEDAVKEVNNKYEQKSVTVAANGTKTYQQGLNELYALIDQSKVNAKSVLRVGTAVLWLYSLPSSFLQFQAVVINSNHTINVYQYTVKSSGSLVERLVNGAYSDLSSNVMSGDLIFYY